MLRVLTLATLFPNAARPNLGGFVARQTLGLAARDGVEVEVVAPVAQPVWPLALHPHYAPLRALPRRETWQGLTVHRPVHRVWPGLGGRGTVRELSSALLPLLREIRDRFPFDVIDAEFFWPDGPAAMRLGEALGVPFSVKARGADIHHWAANPATAAEVAAAAARAGGLLAVSESLRDDMARLGLPRDRIRVHRTGIDLDRFRPLDRAAAKARLGVTGPLLITAGALIPRKGQRFAIGALSLLPDATLIVVGDGPCRAELESLVRTARVADRVFFLGAKPHDELPALFAAADVAVQPSASEGLANVWVESLACGTPVVTTDVGGAREAVDRREAGRLVPREAAAIAAAVRELLADPPPAEAVRASAARFSWARNAEELHAHLEAVAGKAAQPGEIPAPSAAAG
jgi:glycosyltransferase involved in cell wall biosynthesis